MGPKSTSTVLSAEQEAIAVAFRRHTLLAPDDCLYALQATVPHLSRSALHRCFQRHGISRLPLNKDGQRLPKKKLKDYPMGYLHVDFAEVQTEEGRRYLFVAIDRTSKVAFAELHPRAKRVVAAEFLRRVLDKLPYKVPTVLTNKGGSAHPRRTNSCPVDIALTAFAANTGWRTGRRNRLTRGPMVRLSARIAPLKRRPCSASITRLLTNSTSTCKPFCWRTTTPNA